MADTRPHPPAGASEPAVVPLDDLDTLDQPDDRELPDEASARPHTSHDNGTRRSGPASRANDANGPPAGRSLWTAGDSRALSAAHVTEERMLAPAQPVPEGGWRRAVHRATGGLITPRPSAAELERREQIAAATTPLTGSRVIAFASTKGGVGKTTTCVNLGHTFASLRGDRVVAVDGNPDAGSLGYRVRRETPWEVNHLLAQAGVLHRYADVRAFTSQADSRLEVIAAPTDPSVSTALEDVDYHRLLGLLEVHYQLLLVDCGTGILDSATQGIVEAADQLVLVTGTSLDAARASSYLLDWLASHGHHQLAEGAVAVVNGVHRSKRSRVDVGKVTDHFAERCRKAVQVPFDAHLADGATTSLDALNPAARAAYLQLAAAVAGGFDHTDDPSVNRQEATR